MEQINAYSRFSFTRWLIFIMLTFVTEIHLVHVCTDLADHHLVLVVVTGQVRQDTSSTGHHINVITAEQLDQSS